MRRALLALGATGMAVLFTIPTTYSVLRAFDVLFRSEPGPATVAPSWTAHIAMFWRLGISAYVAAMVAPFVYLAARRDLPRTLRALGVGLLVASGAAGVQGLFLP